MLSREKPGSEVVSIASVSEERPSEEGAPSKDGVEKAHAPKAERGCRIWLWALVAAVSTFLFVVFLLVLGALGAYDGLQDRAISHRRIAEEHYAQGLTQLEAGNYELAIAEFEEAMRYDLDLPDLRNRLQEAKDMAGLQVTPTSETRQDAAALLYRQAVPHYESGNLAQAVAILEELRGLDADYQRENVETMLLQAHRHLALSAVRENRLEDAVREFEAVLALKPDDKETLDQLNLLDLYRLALQNWERDWPSAIQALTDLYALAPDYKDVRARLHNAHAFYAEEHASAGDWCKAAEEYGAAAEVFSLEATVDQRDDAAIRCLSTSLRSRGLGEVPAQVRNCPETEFAYRQTVSVRRARHHSGGRCGYACGHARDHTHNRRDPR